MKIKIIFGLGNPEARYQKTYHNLGLQALRKLETLKGEKPWNTLALIRSTVFMNESGRSVKKLLSTHGAKPENLLVIQDDSDLMIGKIKLSFGRNAAGHKGVESAIRALKTRAFWRFRIGIAGKRDIPAEKLVLKKFTPDESRILKKIFKKTIEAIEIAAVESPDRAMNEYHR